jgi:hypothetical protein
MFDSVPALRLHRPRPAPHPRAPMRWRANGFPASILVWTDEEYSRLDPSPADAQRHPLGVWVAPRFD